MFIRLALRNITAHGQRSIVTLLLISITTALLVFATAWMDGSHQTMIKNAVEIYPGYIQITGVKFRDEPSYEHLIFDIKTATQKLSGIDTVAKFASRFESYVLFSVGNKAVGGMLAGIEPKKELELSRLASSLQKGDFLAANDGDKLYIGCELAKRLHVDVGDKLTFIGTGADYSFAADILRVKGIFRTGLYEFDANAAFLAKPYFDQLMASDNYATHIIVLPGNPKLADDLAKRLGKCLGPKYQSASWTETMADLVKGMELDSIFGYITLGIIFIVIFFVIMIYTLLNVFSRIRELGVLRAIGTTPGQIFGLLLLESTLLTLIGVIIGGLLGAIFAWYFQQHPIVFSGFEDQFKQYGLAASAIPTAFNPVTILRDMAVMFILSLLSTLYPILKINRYKPVEAMRHV